jgi:rSAM/selenodomain-associated transferase 1
MFKQKTESRAKNAIVIFAKSPESGHVKTRLQNPLRPENIRKLSEAFLRDTIKVASGLTAARFFLACSPDQNDPFFQKLAGEYRLALIDQKGSDLGERMANTFYELKSEGFGNIVIIGSDLPTLPLLHLRQAFRLLQKHEVVIGPALDGGYYLIGISGQVPPVFDDIPWSTDRVFVMTMDKIIKAKISCGLLPFWYDVDRPEDFRFLSLHLDFLRYKNPEIAKRTRELIDKFDLG